MTAETRAERRRRERAERKGEEYRPLPPQIADPSHEDKAAEMVQALEVAAPRLDAMGKAGAAALARALADLLSVAASDTLRADAIVLDTTLGADAEAQAGGEDALERDIERYYIDREHERPFAVPFAGRGAAAAAFFVGAVLEDLVGDGP